MAPHRPSLSITLPSSFEFHYSDSQIPKTPEAQQEAQHSAAEPPPPPRPQPFKVKRKRVSSVPFQEPNAMLDHTVIPTIEMSEVPSDMSSPTLQPTTAHLLSPMPISATLPRALTPPKTPAPSTYSSWQLESPAEEWDLINNTKPAFERAGSVCSSFSDSSISSCGSSAFSAPTGCYDSPESETADPFVDDGLPKQTETLQTPTRNSPKSKRVKTRRDIKWTPQMDDHLWMTFMSYLSDPRLTPFKMLPGSTPPMGVCEKVATEAKRTWRSRKLAPSAPGFADGFVDLEPRQVQGSPDTIRPSTLQNMQQKWPRSTAATRKRLRTLCTGRPSISAHYQRMLRTRSPSPFETSDLASQQAESESSFSGIDMVMSLVTSTAPSMQPDGMLAQLARDEPSKSRPQRTARPDGWFDRIPRSKAHQKSASLQSELKLSMSDLSQQTPESLDSPFDADTTARRSHLLQSMSNTKSLGRAEFNGRSLEAPVEFKIGAPTDRRSRKRRFRSDEEKPRRLPLEDVFGPPVPEGVVRNRGFSVGAVRASDNLAKLFTPATPHVTDFDQVMGEASAGAQEDVPMGSRSAPRRLADPVPRLGSPFVEGPPPSRQHNTFPRSTLLPTSDNQDPFHQRLIELAAAHADDASNST
ncbi:hypothetical protein DOTSEDRAFT_72957 [Dothistroma septosporum NZE10]|uniref:Uncharacterized protein n=1 Tax=Dothistroma septosporum (strain NZE10 / CBS 128990) TaxID=675120 RepID=N1PIS3_DOTSN|nr:hypothetical protein DOTSEDRAFT_72957 [Dothistroma septosporum NZE10]